MFETETVGPCLDQKLKWGGMAPWSLGGYAPNVSGKRFLKILASLRKSVVQQIENICIVFLRQIKRQSVRKKKSAESACYSRANVIIAFHNFMKKRIDAAEV